MSNGLDILVIDDDPVYGELTLERLEPTGYSAAFYLGPFGTVNMLRQIRPRLAILDVNMPGLDGTGILDLLRKSPITSAMRVLLHSSLDQSELEPLIRLHGADAALHKSATRGEFIALVETLMRSNRRPSTMPP